MALLKRKSSIWFLLCLGLLCNVNLQAQTIFISKDMKIGLFSSTPLEDIKAQAENGYSVIIPKTKQIVFQVPIKSFIFSRALMQEHFNESYMESDKYPNATFKGNLIEDIDLTKDGSYNVTAKGIFMVHGVPQDRTIKGKLDIKNGRLNLFSTFDVNCGDHQIKIPSVVFKKIAETITITVKGTYN